MIYTKGRLIIFKIPTENGVVEEKSIPAQDIFNCCAFWIKQNTAESNESLRNLLQRCPELISMKDSEGNGCSLLIYAAAMGNLEATKSIIELGVDINAAEDSVQQTALHAAVFYNHLEIVSLLIEAGADVNIQDKRKQTPLLIAASKGTLDILKKMTAVNGAGLEIENDDKFSPLHAAAANGHIQIVEHLVNAGVTIDRLAKDKGTALHFASRNKHPDVAKFLVNHGANANIKNAYDETPLYISTAMKELELVKLMVEKGADPYLQKEADSVLDVALDKKCDIDLLNVLWNKESTKKLHQSIIDNNKEDIERLLVENEFTEKELSVFFLFSVNHHQFDVASILLDHKKGLRSKYERLRSPEQDLTIDEKNGVTREALRTNIYAIYRDDFKSKLVFQDTPFENSSEAILDAFSQMCELLCDVPVCTDLLRSVDDELKRLLPQLSEIEPIEKMVIKELPWPTTAPENYQPLDKKGILRKILRSHLQKHNIETQNELYNFAGFVKTETANALVRKGALFKEQFLLGNALTHGLYTHYFQWFLMARAIETGHVKLQPGLSLKDILQASVDVQTKDKKPAWTIIIDNVSSLTYVRGGDKVRIASTERYNHFFSNIPSRYRFSSVMELSSFLYTSSELPHIRGYLLDSLYKNISKIQSSVKDKFPGEKMKQSHMLAGNAVSFWAFKRFKTGLTKDDVDKHYEERAKTQGKLDKETGIVTKPVPRTW